ncbi:6720_t:CDS:2 [Diversispora eburnea]|uniref:6720_t:CDS:1 n=1 Tax=Diversispora eburnea TaxID=1213867 RepID=A0A9N8VC91_9GLOM|nr:6720_t:CDS:2 [Diversispora eburnea]
MGKPNNETNRNSNVNSKNVKDFFTSTKTNNKNSKSLGVAGSTRNEAAVIKRVIPKKRKSKIKNKKGLEVVDPKQTSIVSFATIMNMAREKSEVNFSIKGNETEKTTTTENDQRNSIKLLNGNGKQNAKRVISSKKQEKSDTSRRRKSLRERVLSKGQKTLEETLKEKSSANHRKTMLSEIIEYIELIAEIAPDWCKLSYSIEEKKLVKINHSFPSKEVSKLVQERIENIKL